MDSDLQGTVSPEEFEDSDAVEKFIDNCLLKDEARVNEYKERWEYQRIIFRVLGSVIIGIPVVFIFQGLLGLSESTTDLLGDILVAIIILAGLLAIYFSIVGIQDWEDDDIAFHHLASAIIAYTQHERGREKIVIEQLKETKRYLNSTKTDEISEQTLVEILHYIDAIDDALDEEQAIEQTFPRFASVISQEIMLDSSPIDELINEVDQKPSQSNKWGRAKKDVSKFVNIITTGYWGIVLIAVIGGLAILQFRSAELALAWAVGVFTAYGVYDQYQERESN